MAWDGERTHMVTYGRTLKDRTQAVRGGNLFKRTMDWPEELCNTQPARSERLSAEPPRRRSRQSRGQSTTTPGRATPTEEE